MVVQIRVSDPDPVGSGFLKTSLDPDRFQIFLDPDHGAKKIECRKGFKSYLLELKNYDQGQQTESGLS